jgi:hypothetical protein
VILVGCGIPPLYTIATLAIQSFGLFHSGAEARMESMTNSTITRTQERSRVQYNGEFFLSVKKTIQCLPMIGGQALQPGSSFDMSIRSLYFASIGSTQALISVDSISFLTVHCVKRSGQRWNVEKLYTHRGSVTGIQQHLYDKSAYKLLLSSSNKVSILYLATGECIATQVEHNDGPNIWTQHSGDDLLLLCLTGRSVYHYRWSS